MKIPIPILGIMPSPLAGGSFVRGAHHPHCDRFFNHLIWLCGRPFCLGCTCMYSGALLLGLPLAFAIDWKNIGFGYWMAFHLLLLVPTGLQPWVQKKWFTVISRLALGVCCALYLVSGLWFLTAPFSTWLFRPLVVVAFFAGYKLLTAVRRRYTRDPCSSCPFGVYPTCEWNLPRLLAENPDNPQLSAALKDLMEK